MWSTSTGVTGTVTLYRLIQYSLTQTTSSSILAPFLRCLNINWTLQQPRRLLTTVPNVLATECRLSKQEKYYSNYEKLIFITKIIWSDDIHLRDRTPYISSCIFMLIVYIIIDPSYFIKNVYLIQSVCITLSHPFYCWHPLLQSCSFSPSTIFISFLF